MWPVLGPGSNPPAVSEPLGPDAHRLGRLSDARRSVCRPKKFAGCRPTGAPPPAHPASSPARRQNGRRTAFAREMQRQVSFRTSECIATARIARGSPSRLSPRGRPLTAAARAIWGGIEVWRGMYGTAQAAGRGPASMMNSVCWALARRSPVASCRFDLTRMRPVGRPEIRDGRHG